MIKIENTEVVGWEHAIRGMRNPKNSWDRSDTVVVDVPETPRLDYSGNIVEMIPAHKMVITKPMDDGGWEGIGENDHKLMMQLAAGGPVHAKYRRMIAVYVDITAPLYWWKEFDTYKVGTVANSCSTMHKIHAKEFTMDDFSYEHLIIVTKPSIESINNDCVPFEGNSSRDTLYWTAANIAELTIDALNKYRQRYLETKDKKYWWQMIQLLPSSYNQKRTIMLNYEVLVGIYQHRKNHKLDEWREFCKWIEGLPYSELVTGEVKNAEDNSR